MADRTSYRVRLWAAIRAVLYGRDGSNSSAPISSLDLIALISAYADSYEQPLLWDRSCLTSVDLLSSTAAVNKPPAVCRAEDPSVHPYRSNWIPVILTMRLINCSNSGSGSGGSSKKSGTGTGNSKPDSHLRRYCVSVNLDDSINLLYTSEQLKEARQNMTGILCEWRGIRSLLSGQRCATIWECVGIDPPTAPSTVSGGDGSSAAAGLMMGGSIFAMFCETESGVFKSRPARIDLFAAMAMTSAPPSAAAAAADTSTSDDSSLVWPTVGHATVRDLPPPPDTRGQSGLAFDPKTFSVYVCGGTDRTGGEERCASNGQLTNYRFDTRRESWSALPPDQINPAGRRLLAAIVYRSHVVMASGTWAGASVSSVTALPINRSGGGDAVNGLKTKWMSWPQLPGDDAVQCSPSLAVFDDQLYWSWNELTNDKSMPYTRCRIMRLHWTTPPSADSDAVDGWWERVTHLSDLIECSSAQSTRHLCVL